MRDDPSGSVCRHLPRFGPSEMYERRRIPRSPLGGALERVVIVGRHDELMSRAPLPPQGCRDGGQEVVEECGVVVDVKEFVQGRVRAPVHPP